MEKLSHKIGKKRKRTKHIGTMDNYVEERRRILIKCRLNNHELSQSCGKNHLKWFTLTKLGSLEAPFVYGANYFSERELASGHVHWLNYGGYITLFAILELVWRSFYWRLEIQHISYIMLGLFLLLHVNVMYVICWKWKKYCEYI